MNNPNSKLTNRFLTNRYLRIQLEEEEEEEDLQPLKVRYTVRNGKTPIRIHYDTLLNCGPIGR